MVGGRGREGNVQFAPSNHNVKSVFLYKNFKVIKQTILNVITNRHNTFDKE